MVEVLIAMVLIGMAVVSLVGANRAFTQANGFGIYLSTAEFLVEQAQGLTDQTEYDLLRNSYDDTVYSPPKGVDGDDLAGYGGWSQHLTVQNVSESNFTTVVADGTSDFLRVSVTVKLNGKTITSASWIRADH